MGKIKLVRGSGDPTTGIEESLSQSRSPSGTQSVGAGLSRSGLTLVLGCAQCHTVNSTRQSGGGGRSKHQRVQSGATAPPPPPLNHGPTGT